MLEELNFREETEATIKLELRIPGYIFTGFAMLTRRHFCTIQIGLLDFSRIHKTGSDYMKAGTLISAGLLTFTNSIIVH